jgi:hypothetical protein
MYGCGPRLRGATGYQLPYFDPSSATFGEPLWTSTTSSQYLALKGGRRLG